MSDPEVPPAVRAILEAMSFQAVVRCEREGIALADFLAAMRSEQEADPKSSVTDLFNRTFRRLASN